MPSPILPEPPYYMVSFASQQTPGDNGHHEMGARMVELARRQPGFLGFESCRDASGFGILNSFWTDEESIRNWKAVAEHAEAQPRGRWTGTPATTSGSRWCSGFDGLDRP